MASRIYINGIETRQRIDEITGQKRSMRKFCEAKGLAPETLNEACLKGYGTPITITKYIQAGVPVVLSDTPVPSRLKRERSKASATPKGDQIMMETVYPKAFGNIQNTEAKQMKDVIIRNLKNLIEELEKI